MVVFVTVILGIQNDDVMRPGRVEEIVSPVDHESIGSEYWVSVDTAYELVGVLI